jgi:hypothetical protein
VYTRRRCRYNRWWVGVSSVHAARQVGPTDTVTTFEADADRIDDITEALEHNDIADQRSVVHGIVGEAHRVNAPGDASIVDPTSVSACDVLEMDCEEAEFNILRTIEIEPRTIIVELLDRGYEVTVYDGPWVDGLLIGNRPPEQ